MPHPDVSRHELVLRLKVSAGISDDEIEMFKYFCTVSNYLTLEDHMGCLVMPGHRHFRTDGSEYTFEDVPMKKILVSLASHIKRRIAKDQRAAVFKAVMEAVPSEMENQPEWDKPAVDPNQMPTTPFSASRDVSTAGKSRRPLR
jgi:hypothetical protein